MSHQDVTNKPGAHALFLVYGLNRPDDIDSVKACLDGVPATVKSLRGRFPHEEVSCVIGFGSDAWDHLFPKRKKPAELKPFEEIKGERHTAPSTPGDILLHVRASRMDLAYEVASAAAEFLGDSVFSLDETHGFRYLDSRAIIGFVDGTENPDVQDEKEAAAVIGDGEPDFAGGSYVFVQKYVHDMKAWNALPAEEQEKAVGRRKYDDRELADGVKPENAHNAVTNIKADDGSEIKIVRANMAFANPSQNEHGTYFIGYASTFTATRRMLENMFLGDPPGNTDRLLDFSAARTGTLFFVPSQELLEELAE
ncbi:MAG: Dyp-type peroxidase [Deltaproteobacteria bacterium]|jgi:putative iron-dependent peroxidase|nr:Dyp-type peroxidase [Deltaproteobacteria bacterium]